MDQPANQSDSGGVPWGLITAGIAVLLVVIFVVQNSERAELEFLFFDATLAGWLWVLIVFVLGMAAGWGLTWYMDRRRSRTA